jgi:hypothetical protein
MMGALGIKSLRVGANGMNANVPNAANYDESRVKAFTLPDPLVCTDGAKVMTAEQWSSKRRPEIVEDFVGSFGPRLGGPFSEQVVDSGTIEVRIHRSARKRAPDRRQRDGEVARGERVRFYGVTELATLAVVALASKPLGANWNSYR